MKPLHRTAIGSCAALISLLLAGALILRGGLDGPFHRFDTEATPTVEMAGLPAPDSSAGASELADLNRLAGTTLALVLLAAVTALVSLLGVVGSETLALQARRVIEVMLGAPPRWLVGRAARLWGGRGLWAAALGVPLTVAAVALMAELAPSGISFGRPSLRTGAAGLVVIGAIVALAATLPVRRLYRAGRPLLRESGSRHLTDPRPRQFNRVLMVTLQMAAAVTILTGSGLFLLSRGGSGGRATDATGVDTATGRTFVGILSPTGPATADPDARAALYASVLSAVRDAPEVAAGSLATPGAWIGRGPEVIAANECGRCSTGGMPHPIHTARVKYHAVMPGFFVARGLRLVAGRGFGAGDRGGGEAREVVVNQAYARAHFQDPPVVGKRVSLGGLGGESHVVVGIVRDGAGGGLGASGTPYSAYYSALVHPPTEVELVASVAVGAATGEETPFAAVREALAPTLAGGLMVTALEAADDELERVYGTASWLGDGSRLAGVMAALVAVSGMIGAVRVHVRSRRREMGIRSALGAEPRTLERMIIGEAFRIGAVGVGLGLWGATLVVGVLGPPGVEVFDGRLFLGVGVLFLGSAVGAARPGARLAATAEPRSVIAG